MAKAGDGANLPSFFQTPKGCSFNAESGASFGSGVGKPLDLRRSDWIFVGGVHFAPSVYRVKKFTFFEIPTDPLEIPKTGAFQA